MIGSVSNVSFKQNSQGLINEPGKFTKQPATTQEAKSDEFVPKKSKAPLIAGGIGALLVAAAVTLGVLAHKGKLPQIVEGEGLKFVDKVKNAITKSGEWIDSKATKCFDWAKGLFKKGGEAAEEVAEAAEGAAAAV